jgi:hypothetical protein
MLFSNIFGNIREPTEGSLVLAIAYALERVQEGSIDDESHAYTCNKLVRRHLDKRAITYSEYKTWRRKNPLVFTTIVDSQNNLIGFFDIFPITAEAGADIISGRLSERALSVDHILPVTSVASATHIHIATILVNHHQRSFEPLLANEILVLKIGEFITKHYAPVGTRTYTAFGQSKAGEALLRRCGFSMAVLPKTSDHRWPLFVLRPGDATKAMSRFDRVSNALFEKSRLKDLDLRIEGIELQLRALIASTLDSDPSRLPPHVNQKINERVSSMVKKNLIVDVSRYGGLSGKLELCDLRELEDTIGNKTLWPQFQMRFINKETLGGKFGQLAELRNSIRHSRTVDQIVRKEGEAGILWFEQTLQKADLPPNP